MQTEESEKIVQRFFTTLEYLKQMKIIRGRQTFADRYGINNRNLYKLRMDTKSNIFQVAWLAFLVNDYDVSAEWLITGKGEIMQHTNHFLLKDTKKTLKY